MNIVPGCTDPYLSRQQCDIAHARRLGSGRAGPERFFDQYRARSAVDEPALIDALSRLGCEHNQLKELLDDEQLQSGPLLHTFVMQDTVGYAQDN
jgi:hypothetical protein